MSFDNTQLQMYNGVLGSHIHSHYKTRNVANVGKHPMIKAMLISAIAVATFFSRQDIVETVSINIDTHHIVPALVDTALPPSNPSARAKIYSSQVVNHSLKGDRLMIHHMVHQAADPQHNPGQTPISQNQKIKIGCERPVSSLASVFKNDMIGRCFADVGRLRHASG
jgi:hypothetical protein